MTNVFHSALPIHFIRIKGSSARGDFSCVLFFFKVTIISQGRQDVHQGLAPLQEPNYFLNLCKYV